MSELLNIKTTYDIRDMDAGTIAREISLGHLTSVEAVNSYISHLQSINPAINCLVEDRFSIALDEAKHADQKISQGKGSGKLFGVPISMKEAFDVAGMHTTGGLFHRRDSPITEDAIIVQKLKNEGAIILGKTNTPSLCFCQESENKLFGRTNNPWDLNRTAGGSSGGEGALIAVGGAAAGIGSDIGGSIRFPSHFNGVIGFKSGYAQVDPSGSYPPIKHSLQERMLGIGPMVKTVSDARLIYNIIAKKNAETLNINDFIVDFLPSTSFPLSNETIHLLDRLKGSISLKVAEKIPPHFDESALLWQEIMSIDGGKSTLEAASTNKKMNPILEFLKEKATGKSNYHYYLTWALIGARLFKPSQKRIKEIEHKIQIGHEEINHYLQQRIQIMPVYHSAAPTHGKLYQEIFSIKKTFLKYMPFVAYPNVWGLPSLTMPIGEDESGLPIGVQLISCNGNEEALFQLGEMLEKEFREFKRCTQHDQTVNS